jgi:hypothetical protein
VFGIYYECQNSNYWSYFLDLIDFNLGKIAPLDWNDCNLLLCTCEIVNLEIDLLVFFAVAGRSNDRMFLQCFDRHRDKGSPYE